MSVPKLILLDIEGTTAPVSFVHEVLFPYAAAALPELLRERADDPKIREAVAEIGRLHPGCDPLAQIREWMARDEKIGPLKALQGIAWKAGFESGALKAALYPDVVPCLRVWKAAGIGLAVYSSGSVSAQRLLYGHTEQGDVTGLFDGFYDLAMGGKKDAASYRAIAREVGVDVAEVLFLSDIGAELDAAAMAECEVCQLVRPEDGTVPSDVHPHVKDLPGVAAMFGLPGVA